jgi:putative ABC transport system permease protein
MSSTMWKIALRTLARDKAYALINVAGLAIAIACCLILGVYLRSELTYDHSHENYKRIFRVVNELEINGKRDALARTSTVLGPMLKEENADIQAYVRFLGGGSSRNFLTHGSDGYYWRDTYVVDTNVFEVFTHKILYGDPKTALDSPSSIAISHSVARHYFGDRNPIGETLASDGNDAQVTLVFEDLPENTHLRYDALFSANLGMMGSPNDENIRRQMLYNIGVYTYLLMRPGYDPAKWTEVSNAFFERNMKEFGDRISAKWRSWLQPLADVHLYSDVQNDLPTGNRYYLYGFIAVAVFTLLVACINYMNLATARAAKRAKEVGMRKILGSSRRALIVQFLAESLLLAVVAVVLGLLLVKLAIAFTPISQLFGKTMTLSFTEMPQLYLWLAGLALLVGIGAGLYPAFYLSAAVPITALVGGSKGVGRSSGLRETLVFAQFLISVTVIACTLVMGAQMRYISSMSLGFERENRVNVILRGADTILSADAIKTQLLANPDVLGVSWMTTPMGAQFGPGAVGFETNQGTIEQTTISGLGVGPDFIDVMGLQLIVGRDVADDVASAAGSGPGDRPRQLITEIVVNEAIVRAMHWDDAIGKHFELGQGPGAQRGTVVGVVKDFNYSSVHQSVGPFAIYRRVEDFSRVAPVLRLHEERTMVLNIAGRNARATLDFVGDTMRKFDPLHPFEFEFVDDSLDRLYVADERLTRLIAIFAGLCIFIACLGLFGLASFMAAQRTREIGVRKVFGAHTGQIIALLAHRIVYLVLGAAAVASVISYAVMKAWLQNFAFRADINPLIFAVAALAGLAIAYVTVAIQSMKAARAHPVSSLRYE